MPAGLLGAKVTKQVNNSVFLSILGGQTLKEHTEVNTAAGVYPELQINLGFWVQFSSCNSDLKDVFL